MKRQMKPVAIQYIGIVNLLIYFPFKYKAVVSNAELEVATLWKNTLKFTEISFRALIDVVFFEPTLRYLKLI